MSKVRNLVARMPYLTGSTTDGIFTKEYRVPAGATLNSLYPPFTEINVTTPTSKYDIIVIEALT